MNDHDLLTRLDTHVHDHDEAHSAVHTREREERTAAHIELQRRLDILNHAHEDANRKEADFQTKEASDVLWATNNRSLERLAESVQQLSRVSTPREVYEASQRELAQRAEAVATTIQQANYLPREVFDNYVKDQQARDQRNAEALTGLAKGGEGEKQGSARVTQLVIALVGIALIVAGLVVGLRHTTTNTPTVPAVTSPVTAAP